MRIEEVRKAAAIARDFLEKAKELEKVSSAINGYVWGSKESGAIKRTSMDLTRQLSKMRKPN